MGRELPIGMGVGKESFEVARLTMQLSILCREHGVNALVDLPPDVFQEAMAIQSRIDSLKTQQREAIVARGRLGLAKAQAAAQTRRAARLERVRKIIEQRGGTKAINKAALARELGIGKSALANYIKIIEAQAVAGGPRCLACGQPIALDPMPSIHNERKQEPR